MDKVEYKTILWAKEYQQLDLIFCIFPSRDTDNLVEIGWQMHWIANHSVPRKV
jgi:hypothetical protein